MSFQPRGTPKSNPLNSSGNSSINQLVDQVADAVRRKLVQQGVPLPQGLATGSSTTPTTSPAQVSVTSSRQSTDYKPVASCDPNNPSELAQFIDHTLLKPDATPEDIRKVCSEAKQYKFATVCLNSSYIPLAAELLKGSSVLPIAVVGFPLGAASTSAKCFEAKEAIKAGAREIDMVINVGALKSHDYALVAEDIRQVVEASKPYAVKVILECSLLNQEEKIAACVLSKAANAAFVKTSTGFSTGGATAEDIALMRRVVGSEMGVKASGGVRTFEDACKMIEAGANRIGASSSVGIVTGKKETEKKVEKTFKSSLY